MAKTRASDVMEYRPKPRIEIDSTHLPDIKHFKLGDKVRLTTDAEVAHLSDGDSSFSGNEGEGNPADARFKIKKAVVCKKNCCHCK